MRVQLVDSRRQALCVEQKASSINTDVALKAESPLVC